MILFYPKLQASSHYNNLVSELQHPSTSHSIVKVVSTDYGKNLEEDIDLFRKKSKVITRGSHMSLLKIHYYLAPKKTHKNQTSLLLA